MTDDLQPEISQHEAALAVARAAGNKPGFWLKNHHLDPIRRWTAAWKRRARCA